MPEVSSFIYGRFSKTIPDKFKSYKYYLENFLKNVLDNPYLKNSEQIIEFLNSDRETFIKNITQIDERVKCPVN